MNEQKLPATEQSYFWDVRKTDLFETEDASQALSSLEANNIGSFHYSASKLLILEKYNQILHKTIKSINAFFPQYEESA